ncbi:MAG: hypothetical protein HQK65_18105 [Desulfamplus sp.]|nr:hypothetical protein [Desulfamplus sp.]
MLSNCEILIKILIQEKCKGFNDKTVSSGGLRAYATNWQKNALSQAINSSQQEIINTIADKLVNYSQISISNRPSYIEQIIAHIEERPVIDNSYVELVKQNTQSEINNLHSEQVNLSLQNEQLRKEYSKLISQNSEIQSKQTELTTYVTNLSNEKIEVEEEIKTLRIDHTKLTARKNKLLKEVSVLEEKEQVTLTRLTDLQVQLNELNESVKRKIHIEVKSSELYSKINNLQCEIETIHLKIKQIRVQLSELSSTPTFTRGDGWQDEEKRLNNENEKLNENKTALQNEIEHLREQLQLCQSQRDEIDIIILSKRG